MFFEMNERSPTQGNEWGKEMCKEKKREEKKQITESKYTHTHNKVAQFLKKLQ